MTNNNSLKHPQAEAFTVINVFLQTLERNRSEDINFNVNGANIELLIDELGKHDPRVAEIKKLWQEYHFKKEGD